MAKYFNSGSLIASFDGRATGRWAETSSSHVSSSKLRPVALDEDQQYKYEVKCAKRNNFELALCSLANKNEKELWAKVRAGEIEEPDVFIGASGAVRSVFFALEGYDEKTKRRIINKRRAISKLQQLQQARELKEERKMSKVKVKRAPQPKLESSYIYIKCRVNRPPRQKKKTTSIYSEVARYLRLNKEFTLSTVPVTKISRVAGSCDAHTEDTTIKKTVVRRKNRIDNEIDNIVKLFMKLSDINSKKRRFNRNYDRATAMGKTDPGPVSFDLIKAKDVLDSLVSYDQIVELKKIIPHDIINKLRLTPSFEINSKLSHLYSVLEYAISKGESLIGVEGSSIHGTITDFDVLHKVSESDYIITDITHDERLFESKSHKINVQALKLEEELKELGIIVNVRGVVNVPISRKHFNIALPDDHKSLWDQAYKIIDSITPENIESCRTAAKMFLTAYEDALDTEDIPPERSYKLDEDTAMLVSSAASKNDVNSMISFSRLRDANVEFVNNCIETAEKLAYQYRTNLVRTWELKYNCCQAKSDKTSFINATLLQNDILYAINKLHELDNLQSFYKITRFSAIMVNEPREPFADADCILIGKKQNEHDYILYFNPRYIDDNLVDAIRRKHSSVAKTPKFRRDFYYLKDVKEKNDLTTCERDNENILTELNTPASTVSVVSILSKLMAIVESNGRMGVRNIDGALSDTVNLLIANYKTMPLFNIIEHEYEIAKAFATTLNYPKKSHSYRVCFNGNFNSVTLRQNNAPLDSFTNAFYMVFYEAEDTFSDLLIRNPFSRTGNTVQTRSLSFNRNTLAWELKKIYTIIMLSSWLIENKPGATSNSTLMKELTTDAYRICSVNRNSFAVASEQVRYFYVSTTGRSSNPSAILTKLDYYSPKSRFEVTYLIRTLKMAACLYLLRISNNLSHLVTHDTFGNRILKVCFPHESESVPDFNYSISAFYICNIFNKFKYNVSTSEALCYKSLLDEEKIFSDALNDRPNEVKGLSAEVIENGVTDFLEAITTYINPELDHAITVSRFKAKRYSFSLLTILSIFLTRSLDLKAYPDAAYRRLSFSPADSCTLRGGMSGRDVSIKQQSVRAATVFIEGIIKDYGYDPDEFNKSFIYRQLVLEELCASDVSVSGLACNNYNSSDKYAYRIVHKDQKGEREISVLNYPMRIGAKFVEECSRSLSYSFKHNVLENPDKGIVMSKLIEETKHWKTQDSRLVYDNNDQQRWGPNHLVVTFYALLSVCFVHDNGIRSLLRSILKRFEGKIAKYPESIIDKVVNGVEYNLETTIGSFVEYVRANCSINKFGDTFSWGMCQGILHVTSSIYHSAIADYIEDFLVKKGYVTKIRTLITSDDGFRAMQIPKSDDFPAQLSTILTSISKISAVANIIRSPAKSTFNTLVAEFNSDFYVSGDLYTPNLKQRISKIEAGSGEDYLDDICSALSSATQYYAAGGTYLGSFLLQCVNVCQVTEQWRRWYQFRHHEAIDKSVLLGGLPIISPMITLLGGPISNVFIKDLYANIATPDLLGKYFATIANSPAERVSQDEILRGNTSVVKDLTFSYFQPISLSGFITLTRPHKQASRLERRHKLSESILSDDWITLSASENSFNSLILSITTGSGSKSYEELLGTNTYISRFAESYVNLDAPRFRVGKTTPNSALITGSKMSLREIESYYSNTQSPYDRQAIDKVLNVINKASAEPLINHIVDNITNAFRISLEQQERSIKVVKSGFSPTYKICKLATNRISVIDSESFRLAVFKSTYTGDASKIIRKMGYLNSTLAALPEILADKHDSLIESVKYTKSVVDSYAKYLKHKTKAILKAIKVNRDLYDMVYNSSYYNLSGSTCYKPPKIDLPTSGKVVRICRLVTQAMLSNSVIDFCKKRSESIFQEGFHDDIPQYLSDARGGGLGVIDTLPSTARLSLERNDTVLLIDKYKVNQIHRKLDMLIPTQTNFRFSGRVIRNIEMSKFCENNYCRVNGFYAKSVKENRAPVKVVDHTTIGYCVRRFNDSYRHIIYVTPDVSDAKSAIITGFSTGNSKHISSLIENRLGKFFKIRSDSIVTLSDTDTLQIVSVNSDDKLSLLYSRDSMTCAIQIKETFIPYTILPLTPLERFELLEPTAIRAREFRLVRGYVSDLMALVSDEDHENGNKLLQMQLAATINRFEIPIRYDNFVTVLAELFDKYRYLVEQTEAVEHAIQGNSALFLFMLATQFKAHFNYKSSLTRNLRRSNISKSTHDILFEPRQAISIMSQTIPFETQEVEIAESSAKQSVPLAIPSLFDMDFDDESDDEDDEDDLDVEEIEDTGIFALKLNLNLPPVEARSIEPPEPTLLTVPSLLDGSLFEVYEQGEDDLEEVELHGSRSWSVYDNMSDRNYINNCRNILNRMIPEISSSFPSIRSPAGLLNKVANLHGGNAELSQLYSIMSKYMSLDRLLIVFLCFEFTI